MRLMHALGRRLLILFCLLLSVPAFAGDLCATFRNYNPKPSWYANLCNGDGSSRGSLLGSGYSTFLSAFNLSPAAIPTESLPLGVEYVTNLNGGSLTSGNFALIKGLHNFGAAVTTSNDTNAFYGLGNPPTPTQSTFNSTNPFATASTHLGSVYNFGTAISVSNLLGFHRYGLDVGGMARYNQSTKTTRTGFGLNFDLKLFHVGYSKASEPKTADTFGRDFSTYNFGFTSRSLRFEYTYISISENPGITTTTYQGVIVAGAISSGLSQSSHIFSVSGNLFGFVLTGAIRSYENTTGGQSARTHFAIQRYINGHFSIAYLNNYILDQQSFGIQAVL